VRASSLHTELLAEVFILLPLHRRKRCFNLRKARGSKSTDAGLFWQGDLYLIGLQLAKMAKCLLSMPPTSITKAAHATALRQRHPWHGLTGFVATHSSSCKHLHRTKCLPCWLARRRLSRASAPPLVSTRDSNMTPVPIVLHKLNECGSKHVIARGRRPVHIWRGRLCGLLA
jgi:hypothetical protein